MKRMSYRKQKRWWNAYMLFYTRNDYEVMGLEEQMKALDLSSSPSSPSLKMPAPIQKSIQKQNVRFLHHRNQFSAEYFQFMRKVMLCNAPPSNTAAADRDGRDPPSPPKVKRDLNRFPIGKRCCRN